MKVRLKVHDGHVMSGTYDGDHVHVTGPDFSVRVEADAVDSIELVDEKPKKKEPKK